MRAAPCNKCRSGRQTESDSWCLGCSSLEVTLQLLKRRWSSAGVRAVAEEATLSCARFGRALHNLDSTLEPATGAGDRGGLAAKSKASRPRSRTPVRDERPPLLRSGPSRDPPPRRDGGDREHRDRDQEGRASEYTYDEESEEEAEEERHRTEVTKVEREVKERNEDPT